MANPKSKDITYDNIKCKIEKLMSNPDKIIDFPDTSMSVKKKHEPPDFVRNVMGSSAGAGSGEFHVYRHLRRKEMARLKDLEEEAKVDELDAKFQEKLEANRRFAEERTAKRRKKRDKAKQRAKMQKLSQAQAEHESSNVDPQADPKFNSDNSEQDVQVVQLN